MRIYVSVSVPWKREKNSELGDHMCQLFLEITYIDDFDQVVVCTPACMSSFPSNFPELFEHLIHPIVLPLQKKTWTTFIHYSSVPFL